MPVGYWSWRTVRLYDAIRDTTVIIVKFPQLYSVRLGSALLVPPTRCAYTHARTLGTSSSPSLCVASSSSFIAFSFWSTAHLLLLLLLEKFLKVQCSAVLRCGAPSDSPLLLLLLLLPLTDDLAPLGRCQSFLLDDSLIVRAESSLNHGPPRVAV